MIIDTLPEQSNISAYLTTGKKDPFNLVVPMGATNLILNPSMPSTYPYTFQVGVTLNLTYSIVRRGYSAIQAVFTVPGNYMGLSASLASGTTYTWSFDLYKYDGNLITASIINPSSVTVASMSCTYNGYWYRYSITYTSAATGAHILRLSCAQVTTFYTDGWMLIASPYNSTYIDGDVTGSVYNRKDYFWESVPNYSQSVRIPSCRTGGRIINFSELGLRTIAVIGASGGQKQLVTTKNMFGGSTFQRSFGDEHQITIVVDFITNSKYSMADTFAALYEYLSSSIAYPEQPITLIYDPLDDNGDLVGESLEIQAYYEGGMEQYAISRQNVTARIPLNFRIVTPYTATRIGNNSISSVLYTTMPDSKGLYIQDVISNAYTYYSNGAPGVRCIAQVPGFNVMLIGGDFAASGFGGISGGLVYYDRTTEAFSAINVAKTPAAPGLFYTMAVIPGSQNVVVGGSFSYAWLGSSNLAKINMVTGWAALGGTGANGRVLCSVAADSDTIYIGGTFTTINGVAMNRVAKYTVSTDTFSALGSGSTATVFALAVDSVGNLYATGSGSFGTGIDRIGKWNGTVWSALGTGLTGYSTPNAMALLVTIAGDLYVGGKFTTAGGVTVNNIAKWDGTAWSALGTGVTGSTVNVYGLREENGKIYVCGDFDDAGGLDVLGFAIWDGTAWRKDELSYTVGGAASMTQRDIYNGNLYILGCWYASANIYIPSSVTVTNHGDSITYPNIQLPTGTIISIRNVTTNKAVTFYGLEVLYGEVVTLKCSYNGMELYSDIRGNISKYILYSSGVLSLLPGDNTYMLFGSSDVGSEKAYIQYKDCYDNINTVVVM